MHKADLVLNVFDGVEIEGSKKYGIIYFGGTSHRNNKGDIPEFITQGKYYLFEDGTIIRNSGNGNWAINKDLQNSKMMILEFFRPLTLPMLTREMGDLYL